MSGRSVSLVAAGWLGGRRVVLTFVVPLLVLVLGLWGVVVPVAAQQRVDDVVGAGPLAGFVLVDAGDQSVVAELVDGSGVVVADPVGGSYGLRVELAAGESVGSVGLELSGAAAHSQTENYAPYSLFGDYRRGAGRWLSGGALPEGEYVLRAVAYSQRRLSGVVLGVLEVAFSVSGAEAAEPVGVLAPEGLSATATHRSVRLAWVAPHLPDHRYGDVFTGDMFVERREGGGAWSTLDVVSYFGIDWDSGEAWYHDTSGVVAGAVYEYRVGLEASRVAGGGYERVADVFSDVVAVTVESEAPVGPGGLGAVARGGGVALSWTVGEQPSWAEVFSMRVRRTDSSRRAPLEEVGVVEWERGRAGYEFFDGTALPGRSYRYAVVAFAGAVADDGYEFAAGGGLSSEVVLVATPPAGSAAAGLTQGPDAVAKLSTTDDGVAFIEFPADTDTAAAAQSRFFPGGTAFEPPKGPPPGMMTPSGVTPSGMMPSGTPLPSGTPPSGMTPSSGMMMPSGVSGWAGDLWASSMMMVSGASDDIVSDLATNNLIAQAFWSDGTTIWVSARGSGDWDGKIYAYTLSGGARDSDKDIDLDLPASTDNPTQAGTSHGLWMDDDTVWVASDATAAILGYHRNADTDATPEIEAGDRKSAADFTSLSAAGNANPMGIWADSSDLYVVDNDDARIYVYDRSTKALARTIDTSGRPHQDPVGVWSDGVTLWVSDRADARVYAYRLDNGQRDPTRDVKRRLSDATQRLSDDNDQPLAMWSDQSQLWIADADTTKVFIYNLPADARLRRLAFNGRDWLGGQRSNGGGGWTYMPYGTTQATIDAKALRSDADVTITPADADGLAEGHQVNFPPNGATADITVTVVQGPAGHRQTAVYNVGLRVPPTPSGWDNRIHALYLNGAKVPGFGPVPGEYTHEVAPELTEVSLYGIGPALGLEMSVDGGPYRSNRHEQRLSLDADGSTTFTLKSNVPGEVPSRYAQVYKLTLVQDGLRSLEVSGVNLDDFTPSVTDYARNIAADATEVTVQAESIHTGATVAISPGDADTNDDGHQVTLDADGVTDISVTLTRDGESMQYTLKLTTLAGTTGALSSDNTLSALTLTGVTLSPTFDSAVTDYTYRLTNAQSDDGFTTTVAYTAGNANATVTPLPADDDGTTSGHQIDIDDGAPAAVTVTVAPQDGSPAKVYTVHLLRTRRDTTKDLLVGFYGNYRELTVPYDIWSDGDTIWVLSSGRHTMHAFDLDTGGRQSQHDLRRSEEHSWYDTGLWADGDTMWIAEAWSTGSIGHPYIEAIDMASSTATHIDAESFFDTRGPRDLWSDGETIWVASTNKTMLYNIKPTGGKLQAFDFATKARKPDRDITVTTTGDGGRGAARRVSFALWSDGTVMWVAANEGDATSRLEAYALADGARMPGMDIPVGLDGVTHPRGLWSDGRNMWVLDIPYDERETRSSAGIKAFSLPSNAKLYSLTMSDVDFGHFIHGKPHYTAEVANSVSTTTVAAVAAFDRGDSEVSITAADSDGTTEDVTEDADDNTDGYQVDLATGVNTITIKVTAPNGTDTYTYTVTITRAAT